MFRRTYETHKRRNINRKIRAMKMVLLAILALFTTKKKNFVGLTVIDPTIGLLMNKKKYGEPLNELQKHKHKR